MAGDGLLLANDAGFTAQNAGQIVHRFDGEVRAALATASGPLPWVVSSLDARVGPVTTDQQVAEPAMRLALRGAATEAILWLAGSYRPVRSRPGWLATDPRASSPEPSAP